jgi:hypothetical protein
MWGQTRSAAKLTKSMWLWETAHFYTVKTARLVYHLNMVMALLQLNLCCIYQ